MCKLNPKIILSIWMQLGWFGCVYFGKAGWGAASFIISVVTWALMRFIYRCDPQLIFRLLIFLIIGLTFDSLGVHYNLIQIKTSPDIGNLSFWLISLWLHFVAVLPLLQKTLRNKYFLASLLGAIFGPLSYSAGARFDILAMNGNLALIIYAVFWAIFTPGAIYSLGRKGTANDNH
jgi:hypothetical protein